MKKINMFIWSLVMAIFLTTACDNSGSKKSTSTTDSFLTSPQSCFNSRYRYDTVTGYYYDQNGQRINCDPGYYYGYDNNFAQYNTSQCQYGTGCDCWSRTYGVSYVPVYVQGNGYLCVKTSYFSSFGSYYPDFSRLYQYYGYYPTYATVGGGRNCFGGNGSASLGGGYDFGNGFWLGGQISLCW
ncbi:MAG: hypothetical protein K1X29_04625 [Bdellovibrionales bacterium]|nr:hypothetical protein [Bdellovibrionales bacterium]